MNYVGKTCPYCKATIREDEQVVVCSNCEMPHHKECWIENGGCTTFGCLGTIQSAGQQSNSSPSDSNVSSHVYCTYCGRKNSSSDNFCSSCGRPLTKVNTAQSQYANAKISNTNYSSNNYNYQQPSGYSSQQQNGYGYQKQNTYGSQSYGQNDYGYNQQYQYGQYYMDNNAVAGFVQKNSDYYIRKFTATKQNNTSSSWNWCSFLFTIYWAFYRKMYKTGGILLAINLVSMFMGAGFRSVLGLAMAIVMGILGNNFYMKHVDEQVNYSSSMDDYSRQQHYISKGGTNIWAVFGVLAIVIIVAVASST